MQFKERLDIKMLNYIKSELYRVFHSKGIYLFVGVCSLLMLAMNIVLWVSNKRDVTFSYATTKNAFRTLTSEMGTILILIACLVSIITTDEFKFRTMNNSIAFGLSRIHIYISKLVVNLIVSILALIVISGVLAGSGYALLEYNGTQDLEMLVRAIIACIPVFIAGVIAAVSFYFILGNMSAGTWTYIIVIAGIPAVVSILGMKFKVFARAGKWMMYNTISDTTFNKAGEMVFPWTTQEGFIHCLLVGALGIIIFFTVGICMTRKKEF